MRKNTLYVIGNGFDIFHSLPTKVENFLKILSEKNVYNEIGNAKEIFYQYGVDWNEYENSLAEMNLEILAEENIDLPDYLSDHEYDREGVVWNMEWYLDSLSQAIKDALQDMIKNANSELKNKKSTGKKIFDIGDAILTFNYTSTVEKLYELPRNIEILHIHGNYAGNEELVFGYKKGDNSDYFREKYFNVTELKILEDKIDETKSSMAIAELEKEIKIKELENIIGYLTEDRDYFVDMQREAIISFYDSWEKKLKIEELNCFLEKCNNIENVRVMGHSMAIVDKEYMELIEKKLSPQIWYISQHNGKPDSELLAGYSFAKKVEFYDMGEYL